MKKETVTVGYNAGYVCGVGVEEWRSRGRCSVDRGIILKLVYFEGRVVVNQGLVG